MFSNADLDRIVTGEVDLAFRVWRRPMHVVGGRQRTPVGTIGFTSIDPIDCAALTEEDAAQAGRTLGDLRASLARKEGTVYRIGLRFLGADERVALRERDVLDADELDVIAARLDRMDARGRPWTRQVLELIEARPGEAARSIAATLGWDRDPFKTRVRRLKELGLTESLPIGYRLSPRGARVLADLRERRHG